MPYFLEYLRENSALDVAPAHIKIYAAYAAYFVYTKFQAYTDLHGLKDTVSYNTATSYAVKIFKLCVLDAYFTNC